ncbi:MAG: tetratricopeptide repeat protein [Acidobacteria bacterium]|nr:tetratricopeptide repeat protein [Acidobacteriota bacterium]
MLEAVPPIHIFVGDDAAATRRAALACRDGLAATPSAVVVEAPPAATWPFLHPLMALPPGPVVVWAESAELACDVTQPPHTRLVTTQPQYLFTAWEALLEQHGGAVLVATARADTFARHGNDVVRRRGVFGRMAVHVVNGDASVDAAPVITDDAAALRQPTPVDRLHAMLAVLAAGRTAPRLVATASVCQEVNDLDAAARDLDEAIALAPEWAAAHFERGKVWLRRDDMTEAARAFQAAADRLPRFTSAWGNLGATLGELDRPDEALAAFERQRALDPDSPQAVNNVGVVSRELGRLGDAEAAFRRVIALEPDLAFGHYNLGHTLFLQGRYHAAATAYSQGQARDPERNPVQRTRLALCRLATGDSGGALDELRRAAAALPAEYRRQVLGDTSAVLWALVTQKPDLSGWQAMHEWLQGELARLG